jgi:hypothetical protein
MSKTTFNRDDWSRVVVKFWGIPKHGKVHTVQIIRKTFGLSVSEASDAYEEMLTDGWTTEFNEEVKTSVSENGEKTFYLDSARIEIPVSEATDGEVEEFGLYEEGRRRDFEKFSTEDQLSLTKIDELKESLSEEALKYFNSVNHVFYGPMG